MTGLDATEIDTNEPRPHFPLTHRYWLAMNGWETQDAE